MEARHGTLVANTLTVITFDADYKNVTIINRDGAADIFFLVDPEEGATPSAATVAGDDLDVLPSAVCKKTVYSTSKEDTVIHLISSGTPTYSVIVE